MKKFLSLFILSACILTSYAQKGYYTRYIGDKALVETAKKWVAQGEWRSGFTKADPDESVNAVDFYEQYQKNPEAWRALFEWLQNTDLLAIPKGKHPIEGTQLVASVEDSKNDPIEKRKTESHYHNADFMFVVSGIEGFRLLDHYTSKANTEYKPDVIRYSYEPDKLKTLQSTPGKFIIFFPSDWHIAKVETPLPDQTIRVIVVKMPYEK